MLLLKREDIDRVFTMRDAIDAVKKAFELMCEGGCDAPLRTNIQVPAYDASILAMPAYAAELDAMSIKVISLFPHNIEKGLPSSPAQVMLFDGTTGLVTAMMDGTYVTQLRTGAASGAAFELLAKKDCPVGALIGTGGQAEKQLEAMLTAKAPKEVRVFDMNTARAEAFAAKMQEKLARYGAMIRAAATSGEAVRGADLLITVTPSHTPVFDAADVKPGATISCVGAYQPFMQEMDPQILVRASKLYFDNRAAVLSESGDILRPLADGLITEADFTGDLGDVSLGRIPGREREDEIIVFETVGVAAQDLVTAKRIFDRASAEGVGTVW